MINKYINYLIFVCIIICGISTSAQTVIYNTKIQDGTVGNSKITPSELSILELESTQKGLLLPRMSNNERDNIEPSKFKNSNGLTIFNTDTDCINYWSLQKKEWMSLCGSLPPATIAINDNMCNNIHIATADNAPLEQGKYLRPNDMLFLDVIVTGIGIYDIYATSENGYYFSATGTFLRTGNMKVALQGVGTPIKGYSNSVDGDNLTFYINGKKIENTCSFSSFVQKAAIEYDIVCSSNYKAKGTYHVGASFEQDKHYVEIEVEVRQPGVYRISTETENGVSFSGSGEFTTARRETVKLYAEGLATKSGDLTLKLSTNSDNESNQICNVEARVQDVKYTVDLSKAEPKGVAVRENEKVSIVNSIMVPVVVISPGIVTIDVYGKYDIHFQAKEVLLEFNAETENIQYVNLIGVTGDIPLNPEEIKLVANDNLSITDSYILPVESQPVNYNLLCASKAIKGIYNPEFPMDENNRLEINVKVNFAGKYEVKTNTINGVTFKGEGVFERNQVGKTVPIVLTATGTPSQTMLGSQFFIKTNSSEADDSICSFTIDFKYPDIKVLAIGSEKYAPVKNSNTAVGKILSSYENFGPNGKVKVNSITINRKTSYSRENALRADLEGVDIVFVVYGGSIKPDIHNLLVTFINKGGVVIYSLESGFDEFKKLAEKVDASMNQLVYHTKYTMVNPVNNDADKTIINGVFGDLTGKYLGNDYKNGYYFSNAGPSVEALAVNNERIHTMWAGKHKQLGFVFIGDGGWMAGVPNGTNGVFDPLNSDYKGNPIPKKGYGGYIIGDEDVYNSLFFTNLMEWAIKHVQINRKK